MRPARCPAARTDCEAAVSHSRSLRRVIASRTSVTPMAWSVSHAWNGSRTTASTDCAAAIARSSSAPRTCTCTGFLLCHPFGGRRSADRSGIAAIAAAAPAQTTARPGRSAS